MKRNDLIAGIVEAQWHRPKRRGPRKKEYVTADKLEALVRRQLAGRLSGDFRFYAADDLYYNAPLGDIREIVDSVKPLFDRMLTYRTEVFDCDEYENTLKTIFSLAGYANGLRRAPYTFGIVWGLFDGELHAMNWAVTAGRRFWFIEPQLGEIYRLKSIDHKDIWLMMA